MTQLHVVDIYAHCQHLCILQQTATECFLCPAYYVDEISFIFLPTLSLKPACQIHNPLHFYYPCSTPVARYQAGQC